MPVKKRDGMSTRRARPIPEETKEIKVRTSSSLKAVVDEVAAEMGVSTSRFTQECLRENPRVAARLSLKPN